ncbi:MAG: hypothetical protein ACI9EW_002280 [Cellvibrionaceae bacterium]|jgi:hypothetical protein
MTQSKITKRGVEWLAQTDEFRILHHFDSVCDLINESKQVLALHTVKIGMGPFSCQTSEESFQQFNRLVGVGGAGTIYSLRNQNHSDLFDPYGNIFATQNAILWKARPDWKKLTPAMLIEISHTTSDRNKMFLNGLHKAIVADNRPVISGAARRLAGRGFGLTPEGDDLLIGTMFALHVLNWDQDVIDRIGEATLGQTASLSAAFLQAAVAGEATEPWHQVLAAEPNALEKLLSVGDTSGKDAWVGFVKMMQTAQQVGLSGTKFRV